LIGDELSLNISCSKGTYIRTIIDDLGQMLGCGAHVIVLRRTGVAQYKASQMITFDALEALLESSQSNDNCEPEQMLQNFDAIDDLLLPMDTPIENLHKVTIGEQDTLYFQQGRNIKVDSDLPENMTGEPVVRVYQASNNRFLGVATIDTTKIIQPKRVVVY
jgi:tRNA pseudouridine55 synthase